VEVQFSAPRKNRVQVVCGELNLWKVITPSDEKSRGEIAEALGIKEAEVFSLCQQLASNSQQVIRLDISKPSEPEFSITRRTISSSQGIEFKDADTLECLKKAIIPYEENTILQWDSKEKLAVLDVDYHGHEFTRELGERIARCLTGLRPRPTGYARSRSGGYHGYYVKTDRFSGEELAAVAGIHWINLDRTATFDIVKQVRVPKDVEWINGTTGCPDWLGNSISDGAVDGWLCEKSLEIGHSYSHEQCPVNPCTSHGSPVVVDEWGVYCHRCNSAGVCYGSRKPGVFPYGSLINGGLPNVVLSLVRNFTHWEHARIILGNLFDGISESILRLGYSACLKSVHDEDDPRIERVFTSGNDFIRSSDRWTTRNCIGDYTKRLDGLLATLPACQDSRGASVNDRVVRFMQNVNIREYGYPDVAPIRGLKIYGHNLPCNDPDVFHVVVPSKRLASPSMMRFAPKYRKVNERLPLEDAWHLVEELFPGVNRKYLQLLIAAKGISEGQVGLPPMILVTGPTAAGKTTTVNLAAAMCGDHNTEIAWNDSVERFRQALKGGIDAGSFVTVNEVLKDADRQGSTALEALDVFLNVTPNSVSHIMYIGPVSLGRIPVCVCTELAIPQKLRDDRQLARRFVYLQLDEEHQEWEQISTDAGLMGAENFRTFMEGRGAAASDSIVSDVIDRFFDVPRNFRDIATNLGFCRLIDSQDFDNPEDDLRNFYDVYLTSPENDEGFRYIDRSSETPLAEAWERLNDGGSEESWYTSRRIDECDWKKVLKKDKVLKLVKKKRKSKLLFKFTEKE
jgi:hypothetical protein